MNAMRLSTLLVEDASVRLLDVRIAAGALTCDTETIVRRFLAHEGREQP